MTQRYGTNQANTVGFTVFYDASGELSVAWNSGLNTRNYQIRGVPIEFRQAIVDTVRIATGYNVTTR